MMSKRFTGVAGLLGLLLAGGTAQADTLFGVYAGAGTWQQGYAGDVSANGEAVDLEDDLDLKDRNNNVLYLAVEHGVPVLPNLRLNYTDVSTTGRSTVTRDFTFADQTFTVAEVVASDLELMQADAVAYYQLLDNVVSLDLGLAARYVDGDVQMVAQSGATRVRFEGVLPLLYVRTRADLPFTGLWIGAEAMGLAFDGHQLVDANAQVGWESPIGLGAELGWRSLNLELDSIEDIDSAEIDVSGPYAALNFHF